MCRGNKNIQVILATGVWVMECYRTSTLRFANSKRKWNDVIAPTDTKHFDASLWSWPYKPRKQKTHTFRQLHITGQIQTRQRLLTDERESDKFYVYEHFIVMLTQKQKVGNANFSERNRSSCFRLFVTDDLEIRQNNFSWKHLRKSIKLSLTRGMQKPLPRTYVYVCEHVEFRERLKRTRNTFSQKRLE